jgi:hypothetical protein
VRTVAAVRQVRLNVAKDTSGRVHSHATELVKGPYFARFDGDARLRVSGTVMRFITQQLGFGVAGA